RALPPLPTRRSSDLGVGASIAIDDAEDTTAAYFGDGSVLTGANKLSLTADSIHEMETDATSGAAGGTAVTPVVAISIADDDAHRSEEHTSELQSREN